MHYELQTFSVDVFDTKEESEIVGIAIGGTQAHLSLYQKKAAMILAKNDAENVKGVNIVVRDDNRVLANAKCESYEQQGDLAVFCNLFDSKLVLDAQDPVISINVTVRIEIDIPEEHACTICCTQLRQVVPPCGHFGMCAVCASNIDRCPWCRQEYDPDTQLTRIFHV